MSGTKDSGIYWLGEVPCDWDIVPAWTLFTEGKDKSSADDPHLVPSRVFGVVTRENLAELSGNKPVDNEASAHNMKRVIPNDFIISMGSHESGIEHSTLTGKVSNDYRVLRPTEKANPEFYKWFLKSDPLIEGLRGLTTEIRVGQRIHYSRFALLRFPLPPEATQQRIAAYLDQETGEIDAAVADLDRYVELLERRRQVMIADAVTGRNRAGITRESGIYWMGKIAADWDIVPAWRVMTERKEKSRPDDVHLTPSQTYGVVTQQEYMAITGNKVVLNLTGADNMKRVCPGDFVIHLRSFQGGIEASTIGGKVSNAYTVLTPYPEADFGFFRWFMKSKPFIEGLASSTDQLRDGQSINYSRFSRLSLPLPPMDIQREIADYLDHETSEIDTLIKESTKLRDLLLKRRSVLITDVVTGRKEV